MNNSKKNFDFELTELQHLIQNLSITCYIMAGRVCEVSKEIFTMETIVFWHCDNA